MTFVEVWVGYAVIGSIAYSAAFIWAVRSRQFTDFEKARGLALDKSDSPEQPGNAERIPSRWDRWAIRAMLTITAVLLISAVLVGWRNIPR